MPKVIVTRENSSLVKGSWTPEEDEKLIAYISRYGIWNWTEMPKHAGLSRSGKSCRLRWMNYLKPGVRRGNISKEEEETIISLHNLLGNKWSAIAARFPGRTDNEIKNYWYTYLKKRLEKEPESTTFDVETKEMNSPGGKADGLKSDTDAENGVGLVSPATSFSDSPSPVENFDDVQRIDAIFLEGTIQGFHCFWTEPFVLDSGDDMEEAEYSELFPEPQLFYDHEYI